MFIASEKKMVEKKVNMRGGDGTVVLNAFLQGDQMPQHCRLFSEIVLEPGSSIGQHTHTGECEIYYFLEGEGILDDNGAQYPVKAGDFSICRDGEFHSVANKSDRSLRLIGCIILK